MRRSAPFLLLAASIGCSTDAALAPLASARGALPSAALLPAAAYSLRTVFPLNIGYSSRALDVNDRNQVVGYVSTHAFLADSIGNVTLPGKQPGRYQANAINMRDEVVGRREDVGGTMYPLVWSSPSSQPKELRVAGEAHDINDYGEAVGEFSGPFRPLAFFWDTRTGHLELLPPPVGANWAVAKSINNDRHIVGQSDAGGVSWELGPQGFEATLLPGMAPLSVDAGYVTVGGTQWGKPQLAGSFRFEALYVNSPGTLVAGAMARPGSLLGSDPVIGDLAGNITVLPSRPPRGRNNVAAARAINGCGLVVGWIHDVYALGSPTQAAVWDPGQC